jgi:peroxiredoxin Q/BCP
MLKAGDKAPEFRLKTDDGKEVSLSDFRGKRVLLFFFPKANTSG